MYEFYPKEKLLKMYPILETEANMIINFVSCDGVMGYKLSSVIGSLNPDLKYKFQQYCVDGQIEKGKIIISQKVFPFITHLPYKENFKDQPSLEYLRAGFEKLEDACLNKIHIESIAIQKGIIPNEMLEESLKGLNLPKIIFYEEFDYYKELEEQKKAKEEKERQEALAIKEAEKQEKKQKQEKK